MAADPLTVACIDCTAPVGTPCGVADETYGYHINRTRTAELAAVRHGTCALCGQPMVYGTIAAVTDAWHPSPNDAAACPVLPDPKTDWNAYAMAVNLRVRAGYPGLEHFIPTPDEATP